MSNSFFAVAAGLLPTLIALFVQQTLHQPLPVLGNILLSAIASVFAFGGWVIAMEAVIEGHDPTRWLRFVVYLGVIAPTLGIALTIYA